MRKFLIAFGVALLFASPARPKSAAEDSGAPKVSQLEYFIATEMERQGIPGLSMAVVGPDFTWAKGFGFADLENRVPATEQSSYRMASVTKPMTAIAILDLVEEGKIELDAEVQTYVPWFPKKQYPITIRQLLGHIGGMSHYRNYMTEGRIREPKNTREAIAIFQDFDLIAEPGTKYSYSSYGFNLLGAVIEGASGRSYGEFMRERVWGPMGMTSTRMDDPREIIPNRVRGYTFENGTVRNSEYVDISSRFAGGGTRSTVLDMTRLAREVGRVLDPATVTTMWTTLATRDGKETGYGLGWSVGPLGGRPSSGHSGSQQETRTLLVHLPREGYTIAVASNYEDASLWPFVNRAGLVFLGDTWGIRPYVDKDEKLLEHIWVDDRMLRPEDIRKLKLDRKTKAKLEQWSRDWYALLSDDFVRARPEDVAASLRGRTIIPNYANELLNVAERRKDSQLAALVAELYPRWASSDNVKKRMAAITGGN